MTACTLYKMIHRNAINFRHLSSCGTIEEALKPIKNAMQKPVTDEKMKEHIENMEQNCIIEEH